MLNTTKTLLELLKSMPADLLTQDEAQQETWLTENIDPILIGEREKLISEFSSIAYRLGGDHFGSGYEKGRARAAKDVSSEIKNLRTRYITERRDLPSKS
jgi:hypothetical protein